MAAFKKKLLLFVKIICLLVLIKSVFDVTFDYLRFGFEYKLIVSDNTLNGFDLPAISVCTESNVLFDKQKVIKHFGVEQQWDEYLNEIFRHYKRKVDNCKQVSDYRYGHRNGLRNETATDLWLKYCSSLTFKGFNFHFELKRRIFTELGFHEMNSLKVNAKELFECSAKIHFRNESFDSNSTLIHNCFDKFEVLESIYANNDFGICYTFFANNYSVYLKDDDYVRLKVKFNIEKRFLINDITEKFRFVWDKSEMDFN